jgi:RNA recognition motif-containing protein
MEDGSELKDQSLQRTVFVGNLSETITKKILKAHIQKYDFVHDEEYVFGFFYNTNYVCIILCADMAPSNPLDSAPCH